MSVNYRILGPIVLLIIIGATITTWISYGAIRTHDIMRTQEERAYKIVHTIEKAHEKQAQLQEFINRVLGFNEVIHPQHIKHHFSILMTKLSKDIQAIFAIAKDEQTKQALAEFMRVKKIWRQESKIALGIVQKESIPTIYRIKNLEREVHRTLDAILVAARSGANKRAENARRNYEDHVSNLLFTMLAIFTIFGLFFVGFGRQLAKTLSNLAHTMECIYKGDYSAKADVDYKGEVGKIAYGVEALKTAMQALTKANVQIKHLAMHDQLTNLPNRRALAEYLEKLLEKGGKEALNAALFHVDLDRFKQVNDTLGHAAGDQALIHAAKAMKRETRKGDLISRVGGDEFVVILNDAKDKTTIANIANRIIAAISEPITIGKEITNIGASIGIALLETNEHNVNQLLSNADMALYVAKENGRGQYSFYSEDTGKKLKQKISLLTDLPAALDQGQILPYFQPQIDAEKGIIIGFEALARWHHPKRGLLGPGKFLNLAFENGYGAHLTDVMVQQSINALIAWRKKSHKVPHVSINFSTKQLEDYNIAKRMHDALHKAGLSSHDMVIEILESVFFGDETDPVLKVIAELKQYGFRVELDDFGTGHASISYLQKFAVDGIKIDRSFVTNIDKNPAQKTIVQAMVELCKNLDIDCIAEGIETEEEKNQLLKLGCPRMQGYVFAKPMSFNDVTQWLCKQKT